MATYQGQTVDVYEDFEDSTQTGWTKTDGSGVLTTYGAAAAQYPGSTGSGGMLWDAAGNHAANLQYASGSNNSSMSFGFWYYMPAQAAWEGRNYAFCAYDVAVNEVYKLYIGGNADSPITYSAIIRNTAGDWSTAITLPSADTWYWLTGQAVQNGDMSISVYNTSNTQVGVTRTTTTGNFATREYRLAGNNPVTAGDVYWDDFCLDITDATFPLLGWTVGGGATNYNNTIMATLKRRRA